MTEWARHLLYWPRITKDIYDKVQSCVPCARSASARPNEPMIPSPAPMGPGDQVAADFCSFQSRAYLVFYDVFSNFPFCFPVKSESTSELLRCTRTVFLQTGMPSTFASDNGAAFVSREFQAFLDACGTVHRASSPRYPQSNGAAERAVQTVKRILARCTDEDALFRALLYLQNTRRPDLGASPSELFFGRQQRSPVTPQPRQYMRTWASQQQALDHRRVTQAKYYDRLTRCFSRDLSGLRALLRDFVSPVVEVDVLSPAPAPRAYYVRLPSGTVTIRNQCFLRPLPRLHVPSPAPSVQHNRPCPPPMTVQDTGLPHDCGSRTASSGLNVLSPFAPRRSARVFPPAQPHLPSSVHRLMMLPPSSCGNDSPVRLLPSPVTASGSSSAPGSHASTPSWTSAPESSSPSSAAMPPAPHEPASPVTARPNPLGVTRRGRPVFPSLRAQEGRQSGQWNPLSILRPVPLPSHLPPAAQPPLPPPPGLPPPLEPPPGLPPPQVRPPPE
jgi:transposase InsO family protein